MTVSELRLFFEGSSSVIKRLSPKIRERKPGDSSNESKNKSSNQDRKISSSETQTQPKNEPQKPSNDSSQKPDARCSSVGSTRARALDFEHAVLNEKNQLTLVMSQIKQAQSGVSKELENKKDDKILMARRAALDTEAANLEWQLKTREQQYQAAQKQTVNIDKTFARLRCPASTN